MKIILFCLLILIVNITANAQTPDVNDFVVEGNLALSQEKYTDAISQFDKVIKIEPQNYLAYYGKAVAYEKLAKFDTAMYNIKKTLNYKSDFSKAHYLCGLIRYEQKQFSKCIFDFENAVKYDNNLIEAILLSAYAKEKIGMYKEAAIGFNLISEILPNDRKYPLKAAITLIKNDDYNSAINLIRTLTKKYPDYDTACYYCGVAYQKIKQYDSAITYFTKTLELNPNYFEAMNFRGRTIQKRDSTSTENDDLKNWKLIKPDAVKYYMDKGYELFFDNDYRNAGDNFAIVLSFDSLNADAYFNLANCCLKIEDFERSLYYADKCLEFQPNKTDALLIKMKVHYKYFYNKSRTKNLRGGYFFKGNLKQNETLHYQLHFDTVLYLSEKILEKDSQNYETYKILGDLYKADIDYVRSIKNYNKALEIFEDPEIYAMLSVINYSDNNNDKSMEYIEKAISLDPDNKLYLVQKIFYISKAGDEIKSNKMLEDLIENGTDLSQIYYYRGLVKFYSSKNYKAAILDMDKAIELDSYNADAYEKRSELKELLEDKEGAQTDRKLYEKYKGKI